MLVTASAQLQKSKRQLDALCREHRFDLLDVFTWRTKQQSVEQQPSTSFKTIYKACTCSCV